MAAYHMQKKDFENLGIKNIIVLDKPVSILNRELIQAERVFYRKEIIATEDWLNDLKVSDGVLIIMETPNEDEITFENSEFVQIRMFKQI